MSKEPKVVPMLKSGIEALDLYINQLRKQLAEAIKQRAEAEKLVDKNIGSMTKTIDSYAKIAELARDFIWEPENWEAYTQSKVSNSVSWPPEFLLLAQAVEEKFGHPIEYMDGEPKESWRKYLEEHPNATDEEMKKAGVI